MNITWNEICNETTFYKVALKVYTKFLFSPSKAFSKGIDDKNFYDFAQEKKAKELFSQLKSKKFNFRSAKVKKLIVNKKEKLVYLFPWEERLADALLYNVLSSKYHTFFSKNSYAYKIKGGGVDFCQDKIAKCIARQETLYIIKRDISNYFPSINHEILKTQLSNIIKDPDVLDILNQRINFKYQDASSIDLSAQQGIPFGSPIACFFANIYLDKIDKLFESQSDVEYFRYADDFLIITPSRSKALEIIESFDREINLLKLNLKPSHNKNFILSTKRIEDASFEHTSKFKHLGLEYRADKSVGLSRDKVRKILNLAKRRVKKGIRKKWSVLPIEERAIKIIELANKGLTENLKSVAIVDYYLKHVTDEKQLALIDRYVAETILAYTLNRGYKKSNFKILEYKRLRELGLMSLVHRSKLLRHQHIESRFFVLRNKIKEVHFEQKKKY